jgi:diguanylate cyclase (GGDEF)-like protein/PAS domain S-box-containing protein
MTAMAGRNFLQKLFGLGGGATIGGTCAFPVQVEMLSSPALIMDARGSILAVNGRAEVIARAITGNAPSMSAFLVSAKDAAQDQMGRKESIEIPEDSGEIRFELSLVPIGSDLVLVLARDITLDCNLRDALVESRQRFKDLVEISSDFAWEVDVEGQFAFVSPAGALGWAADQLVGRHVNDFLAAGPDGDMAHPSNPFCSHHAMQDGELWFKRADGTVTCLSASVQPLQGVDGQWSGARGVCRDVTEDRARDAALAQAHSRERLFSYILRTMRDEMEPESMMKTATAAIARALTATETGIYSIQDGVPVLAASNGEALPVSDGLIGIAIGRKGVVVVENEAGYGLAVATRFRAEVNGVLHVSRDATLGPWSDEEQDVAIRAAEHLGIAIEQVAEHEQLQTLSRTDGMTGLLNRRSFIADLARRYARASHGGTEGTLIYCDLDNFKQVNDTHGHEQGDKAICEAAKLLQTNTRGGDLVARLGGDEFAVWLDNTNETNARLMAEHLLVSADCLKVFSGSEDCPLGMSLGVAVQVPGSDESLEALMARADEAMYASKKKGKGQLTLSASPDVGVAVGTQVGSVRAGGKQ